MFSFCSYVKVKFAHREQNRYINSSLASTGYTSNTILMVTLYHPGLSKSHLRNSCMLICNEQVYVVGLLLKGEMLGMSIDLATTKLCTWVIHFYVLPHQKSSSAVYSTGWGQRIQPGSSENRTKRMITHEKCIFMFGGAPQGHAVSPVNRILLPFMHEICDFHPLPCPAWTSRFLTRGPDIFSSQDSL